MSNHVFEIKPYFSLELLRNFYARYPTFIDSNISLPTRFVILVDDNDPELINNKVDVYYENEDIYIGWLQTLKPYFVVNIINNIFSSDPNLQNTIELVWSEIISKKYNLSIRDVIMLYYTYKNNNITDYELQILSNFADKYKGDVINSRISLENNYEKWVLTNTKEINDNKVKLDFNVNILENIYYRDLENIDIIILRKFYTDSGEEMSINDLKVELSKIGIFMNLPNLYQGILTDENILDQTYSHWSTINKKLKTLSEKEIRKLMKAYYDKNVFIAFIYMNIRNRILSQNNITDINNIPDQLRQIIYENTLEQLYQYDISLDQLEDINVLEQFTNYVEQTQNLGNVGDVNEFLNTKLSNYRNNGKVRISPLHSTVIKIKTNTIAGYPIINSSLNINNMDELKYSGIEIFDQIVTSPQLPYVKYNVNGRNLYKIYEFDSDEAINYSSFEHKKNNDDTLYLTLVIDENIYKVKYDLNDNLISVEVKQWSDDTVENIKSIINSHTPLTLNNIIDSGLKGNFKILGVEIQELVFLQKIMEDNSLSNFLYILEDGSIASNKKVTYNYKPPNMVIPTIVKIIGSKQIKRSPVEISIKQAYTNYNETFDIVGFEDDNVRIGTGTAYLNINIERATDKNIADHFNKQLSYLLSYYFKRRVDFSINEKGEIEVLRSTQQTYQMNFFKRLIYDLKDDLDLTLETKNIKQSIDKQRKVRGRSRTMVEAFREFDRIQLENNPNYNPLFSNKNNYTRVCQHGSKPIIIKEEEIEDWQELRVITHVNGNEVSEKRQVALYPPPQVTDRSSEFYFVCHYNEKPYPGINENTKAKIHKEKYGKYPFIPCCFKEDHINNPKHKYNKLNSEGELTTMKTKVSGTRLTSIKAHEDGRISEIPMTLKNILRNIIPEVQFSMLGFPKSNNSLLHAVVRAVDPSKYKLTMDQNNRDEFIMSIRSELSKNVNPSLLKQELYDYTSDEIIEKLSDNSIYFNSSKFYRAIEEAFNINLFVFTWHKKEIKLEIPRHKSVYIRPSNDNRSSIIVIRFKESDGIDKYQLVVLGDKYFNSNGYFGSNVTTKLYQLFNFYHMSYTWNSGMGINNNGQILSNPYDILANLNFYSILDISNNITDKIVSQIIDDYGKTRAYNIEFEINDIIEIMTIIVPPTRPGDYEVTDLIHDIDMNLALNVMNNFELTASNPERDGLWYKIGDIPFSIYIPIKNVTNDILNLQLGPSNPLLPLNVSNIDYNITERYEQLKKKSNIMLQYVKWVFDYCLLSGVCNNGQEFIDNYITYLSLDTSIDTNDLYNLDFVEYRLPEVNSYLEAFNYISNIYPGLVNNNNQIVLHSLKMFQGVSYFIKDYYKSHQGLIVIPSKFINHYYDRSSDFISYTDNLVLISDTHYVKYINSLRDRFNYIIETKIKNSFSSYTKPYIFYSGKHNKMYLIQNIIIDDNNSEPDNKEYFNKALYTAFQWYSERINIGNNYNGSVPVIEYPYVEYMPATDTDLVVTNDKSMVDLDYLQILRYSLENSYAAVLPLY